MSVNVKRRGCHWLMSSHPRNASQTLEKDEQYGIIIRLPEPSTNGMTLPWLPVLKRNPTSEASMLRIKSPKYRNRIWLQNMGTVVARRMTAPRHSADDGTLKRMT